MKVALAEPYNRIAGSDVSRTSRNDTMSPRISFVATLLALAAIPLATCSADLVRLRNGGEIRGEVDKGAGTTDTTLSIETLSGVVVTVERADVEFVTYRRLVVEEYETRARLAADDLDSQWALAQWCRENGLLDERVRHLERVVEFDPDHEEARRLLRHVKFRGEWTTQEAAMRAQGYVKYRNRYITPQELELIQKTDLQRETEKKWYADVRRVVSGLEHRSTRRRAAALAELEAITDPAAVPALVKNFASAEHAAVRMVYVNVLGSIAGPAPIAPLVDRVLKDADYEVRYRALNLIGEERAEAAVPLLARSLKSDDNNVVRRAANGLARYGGQSVVPHLIDALVTQHKYKVAKRSTAGTLGFRSDGSGMTNPGQLSLPLELQAMMRNGAIVQTPQSNPHARVKWVTVKADVRNTEVHTALVKLTGQDFGYNERTWTLWWASRKSGGTS